ncbi:hypothetical protein [Vibrio gallicus]|uniref:hypothetical protein n=1 Tax=Vibrio gallicus TaxID=190897 RepID=UPI0021C30FA7|nr:hypothetical protein [Vibrio gallicus]
MLTKEITQELNSIFQALEAEGKEPSMALVKARLSSAVPLPALISAIKNWKSSRRIPKIEVAAEPTLSTDQKISALEEQVKQLTARLEALEQAQK